MRQGRAFSVPCSTKRREAGQKPGGSINARAAGISKYIKVKYIRFAQSRAAIAPNGPAAPPVAGDPEFSPEKEYNGSLACR